MTSSTRQLELFPVDTKTDACTSRWKKRNAAAKKGLRRSTTTTWVKRKFPGSSPKCVQSNLFHTKCSEGDPFALELLSALREVIEEDKSKALFDHPELEDSYMTKAELVRLLQDMRHAAHI